MNILAKALYDVSMRIPPEILRVVFKEDVPGWQQSGSSQDERILSKVIRPRVLMDCNLVGGQTIIVALEGLSPRYVDTYSIIYEIPAHLVAHRSIISVLSIGYLPFSSSYNSMGAGMGTVNANSMSDLMSAGQRMGDAVSNIPPISNASVELIGYNTVLIRDQLRVTNSYQLRCVVANDEHMSNMQPRTYLAFGKLCELAIKSYIYNNMIIAMDQAYLSGGQELGQFKAIVESYSDAEEQYGTYLNEVWRPISFMSSTIDYTRFLKLQVSPGL